MKELVWDRTLSVEVEEIDEDHRRLVALFNLLRRAVADGDAPEYQEAVLEELAACTAWHFRHEERLMLKYAYGGRTEHAAEHAALIDSARALQRRFRDAGGRLGDAEIAFLEHWLTEHILVADIRLGAFLVDAM